MRVLSKPFLALTAADLMSTTVVSIPGGMSLQGAARLLSQWDITGAPVVDGEARCIGVLSATDFMSWVEKGRRAAKQPDAKASSVSFDWQVMDIDSLPEEEVSQYMTADPVTAAPTTPIIDLARMMVDAHIHRTVVVDEANRPVGIVSSLDILSAVAYADLGPSPAEEG